MTDTLTRADIAAQVQKNLGFSFSESNELVDSLVEEMCIALETIGSLKVSSFGTFVVNQKGQRIGRNPKTKEEAVITPRKVVSFYSSNILVDEVNGSAS
jgi:integration host factor subunit alpha